MRNTFILPGPHTFDELVSGVSKGLFAAKMGGGSVNPATGEFNFSVREAYLIENGKVTKPFRGATLIGNGKDVLNKISMVGKDLELSAGMCGSSSGYVPAAVGQPPILVSNILVGGRK
jgi:TldD protein